MGLAVQEYSPVGETPLVAGGFEVFAVLVTVGMVAGVALFVWLLVRNVRLLRRVGPGTRPSVSQRLQELDDLHRQGRITAAEHALARQRVLASS